MIAQDPRAANSPEPVTARADWRWLSLVVLVTLVVVEIPYLIAYSQARNGWVFAGMLWSPHDFAQYASAMRQGAASSGWLIYNHLSHEAHDPAFIYPVYVGLGKLASLTGMDFDTTFHLAEILGRALLIIALYRASHLLFADLEQRRRALLIGLYASGLSVWVLAIGIALKLPIDWLSFTAVDLRFPEFNTFLALFTAPHLTVGLAAILLWSSAYVRAGERWDSRTIVATGAYSLVIGLTHPFSLIVILAVSLAHTVSGFVLKRRISVPELGAFGITTLVAGPLVVYNVLVFARDPFWGSTYGAQNILPTDPPLTLLLGFGAPLVLGLIALPTLVRQRSNGARLLVVWIALSLALMYAPVSFQRRFGFGLLPLLALAATLGIEIAFRGIRPAAGMPITLRWRLARSSTALALFGSTITFYALMVRASLMPADHFSVEGAFHQTVVDDAATWLAQESGPDDLILAQTHTGNYIGGSYPGRVYTAHWVATADFLEKVHSTNWFFQTRDTDARQAFLSELGVRYVVFGPYERAIGGIPPENVLARPVFEASDLTIYEVLADAASAH